MKEVNLDHLKQLAYNAYRNTSFSPERRAADTIRDYTAELNADLKTIAASATPDIDPEVLEGALSRYQHKYESHLSAWLHSHSNLASSAIVGPSNFPVARMEKRNRWADNKYDFFREWRQRALKAISKSFQPKKDELDETRKNLERRQQYQKIMVESNKIIRKGGDDVTNKLLALGLTEPQIKKLLTPDWGKRIGFKPYELTNNNAEIKRLQNRVSVLEEKKKMGEQGNQTEDIGGVKLVHNFEADRVQLFFEGQPEQDILKELHSRGFHWAPSIKAWQRKLTKQAVFTARNIASKGKKL